MLVMVAVVAVHYVCEYGKTAGIVRERKFKWLGLGEQVGTVAKMGWNTKESGRLWVAIRRG